MSEKININTADLTTLTTISGIGPALAERIVEFRETVHPFEEVIELAAVPGISEKMVRGFEDWVTVQSDRETTAVPQKLDEPEDVILLDAPEEVELLSAPDQPEALLAAELPDTPQEAEEALAADTTPAELEQIESEASPTAVEDEIEDVTAETAEVDEMGAEPFAEEDEVETDTAVATAASLEPETEDPLQVGPSTPPPSPEPMPSAAPAAPPPQPPVDWEAKAQRRGCLSALVGATFGAILGAVLTLAILAALNQGSLNFAASDTAIRQQLDTEIISRTNELNQLSTRVSVQATQAAAAHQSLEADFATANDTINEALTDNETLIGNLEQRLEDVAGAADTFTDFLDGLRLLLDDLEEGTATPTPAPAEETVSPTPTPTPASVDTAAPTATTAVPPTRTPQPTATPFTFPTNTPAPQP